MKRTKLLNVATGGRRGTVSHPASKDRRAGGPVAFGGQRPTKAMLVYFNTEWRKDIKL